MKDKKGRQAISWVFNFKNSNLVAIIMIILGLFARNLRCQ